MELCDFFSFIAPLSILLFSLQNICHCHSSLSLLLLNENDIKIDMRFFFTRKEKECFLLLLAALLIRLFLKHDIHNSYIVLQQHSLPLSSQLPIALFRKLTLVKVRKEKGQRLQTEKKKKKKKSEQMSANKTEYGFCYPHMNHCQEVTDPILFKAF